MKRAKGDLWAFHPTHWIVVPTNLGWNKKGQNIMGAGVAEQARERFPHLPDVWGRLCRVTAGAVTHDADVALTDAQRALGRLFAPPVHFDQASRCVFFPTKPLDKIKPSLSWKLPADLELIAASTSWLSLYRSDEERAGEQVALPLVGCGYGGLSREQVLPILERLDDNFTLVEQ